MWFSKKTVIMMPKFNMWGQKCISMIHLSNIMQASVLVFPKHLHNCIFDNDFTQQFNLQEITTVRIFSVFFYEKSQKNHCVSPKQQTEVSLLNISCFLMFYFIFF